MKILICIPVYHNVEVTRECLNAITFKDGVTIFLLNNGGGSSITSLFEEFCQANRVIDDEQPWNINSSKTYYKVFPENIYVTKAWNYFLEYFLGSNENKGVKPFDRLIIMNNDLTLQKNWLTVLKNIWEPIFDSPYENASIVPTLTDDKTRMFIALPSGQLNVLTSVDSPPGIFITLTMNQAKLIYPIPEEIKIWYNDTWIYSILKAANEKIINSEALLAYHHTSTTVNSDWAHRIIEDDKIAWENIVEPKMIEKINQLTHK